MPLPFPALEPAPGALAQGCGALMVLLRPEAAAACMLLGVSAGVEEVAERAVGGSCRELQDEGMGITTVESISELL